MWFQEEIINPNDFQHDDETSDESNYDQYDFKKIGRIKQIDFFEDDHETKEEKDDEQYDLQKEKIIDLNDVIFWSKTPITWMLSLWWWNEWRDR